jgi:hypothetical protein
MCAMLTAERQLQVRRLWRPIPRIVVGILLLTSLLDHAGLFGYHGNDWQRFDRHTFTVAHLIDDQSFDIGGTVVRLLGVGTDEERVTSFVQSNLDGRQVMLRLDTPQTRDAAGELLAYVYLSPSDCWNVDLIRDGSGDADRRTQCSMLPVLIAAEAKRDKAIGRHARKSRS